MCAQCYKGFFLFLLFDSLFSQSILGFKQRKNVFVMFLTDTRSLHFLERLFFSIIAALVDLKKERRNNACSKEFNVEKDTTLIYSSCGSVLNESLIVG